MKCLMIPLTLVSLLGCQSMQVQGFVTDSISKNPVATCQVRLGRYYAHTDPAGHYAISTRRSVAKANRMKLQCVGYEPLEVDAYRFRTRVRDLDLEVAPLLPAPGRKPLDTPAEGPEDMPDDAPDDAPAGTSVPEYL